ncbi:MAG TPA: pantoate--beta-alanine ligase [Methylophaga sp.]|nr:pantoate--beta-alanine ligase [Methylophaga sp.]
MQIEDSLSGLRAQLKIWREQHQTIAFVPTMGSLHDGHLALLKKARTLADKVIVSIYVNPLQFDDLKDLTNYPRTLKNDIQKLTSAGCDLLFTPDNALMYPSGLEFHSFVHVPGMDDKLCGLERPGHFDGVATVVCKLFNMVQPDLAVFGEKDYQQLLLIRKLVQDLNLPVKIVAAPTCRESDGLAMSSRNQRLTDTQRSVAVLLNQQLSVIKRQLEQGERDVAAMIKGATEALSKAGFSVDYLEIRRAEDLLLADVHQDQKIRILVAARLDDVRLIDNVAANLSVRP